MNASKLTLMGLLVVVLAGGYVLRDKLGRMMDSKLRPVMLIHQETYQITSAPDFLKTLDAGLVGSSYDKNMRIFAVTNQTEWNGIKGMLVNEAGTPVADMDFSKFQAVIVYTAARPASEVRINSFDEYNSSVRINVSRRIKGQAINDAANDKALLLVYGKKGKPVLAEVKE